MDGFSLFKNIRFVHPPDGSPSEYQEQDEMEYQETTPDQQGNVDHADGFLG